MNFGRFWKKPVIGVKNPRRVKEYTVAIVFGILSGYYIWFPVIDKARKEEKLKKNITLSPN